MSEVALLNSGASSAEVLHVFFKASVGKRVLAVTRKKLLLFSE